MQKPRLKTDNYFAGGMHADNDVQLQPPGTYRYSLNGRILFNQDGGYAWENDKGNALSFTMTEYDGTELTGYQPIGWAEFADKVVIFSTNGTNSEIGFFEVNNVGTGSYTQIFNDKYDPNGDLLNFDVQNSIEAVAVKETDDVERVYWVDGIKASSNERRCMDILEGAAFSYEPDAVSGLYPWWYSVHQMARYADWSMGRIKYVGRIEGSLKTGVYQYSYRQRTSNGYATDWYPLTRHLIMNSQAMDTTNSNNYQMQPSNDVTEYGFQLLITDLDNRFRYLDVAYVYSIAENATVEAGIFHSQELFSFPTPTIAVNHTSHAAEPLNPQEFNIHKYSVVKAKSITEKDTRLFELNCTETGILEPDLSAATITPVTRNMLCDSTPMDRTSKPFLSSPTFDTTVSIPSYTGASESYSIDNEYMNYKGTQWEHLFTSYWRGETYRIGMMLFDRKGIPNYVFHLDDFTFPEQYDPSGDFTLTESTGGSWYVRILGFQVDGIRIPSNILYGDDGKLNVSGFAIVRARRPEQTRFQGVIMNTVFENNNTTEDSIERYNYTRPLPFTENCFDGSASATAGAYYNNALLGRGFGARGASEYASRAGTFLMYSPEIMFGYKPAPTWENNHRLKLVGNAVTSDHQENLPGYNRLLTNGNSFCHFYSKNYDTDTTGLVSDYQLGDTSFIDKRGLDSNGLIRKTDLFDGYSITDYDNQRDELIYSQYVPMDFAASGEDCCCCRIDKFAWGCPDSLLLIAKNFSSLHCTNLGSSERNRVFLANYQEPISAYYGTEDSENSLETTVYQMCGHFQPINEDVVTDTVQDNGDLLFNGVEVWGGDCYPGLFDFTRLLPQYRDCDTSAPASGCQDYDGDCEDECYKDYAVSMIVPLESNINFSMRYGRQFAKNGTEPENTACGSISLFKSGIQEKQREDFNINSVLMHEENIQFFAAISEDIREVTKNPFTVIHSESKIYGEPIDNFRINLANNILDLTGKYGDGVKLFTQYSFLYFLQEHAFGRLFVNEQALLSSPTTGSIITGSSGVLTGALYISDDVGCQHQFSVTQGHNATYWVDADLGKMYRFTQNGTDPLSDIKGYHNKVRSVCQFYRKSVVEYDSPQGRGGIHGVYDYKNNEVVMTWRRGRSATGNDVISANDVFDMTLVYNEFNQAFVTEMDIYPKFWCSFRGFYFSTDNETPEEHKLWVHLQGDRGSYYGASRDSKVEVISQPDAEIHKIYDACMVNVNDTGYPIISRVNAVTENQSIALTPNTDTRARYRHNMLWFPVRTETQTDRVRGKYLSLLFTIDNTDDDLCRLTLIETKFRIAYSL